MPAAFLACVKAKGKIRTKLIGKNKYMRICFRRGKSYPGEVMTRKKKK